MTDCTYCGCEVEAHDPVYVDETRDGERVGAGAFCNWGCLAAHVDEADLTTGTACNWEPA